MTDFDGNRTSSAGNRDGSHGHGTGNRAGARGVQVRAGGRGAATGSRTGAGAARNRARLASRVRGATAALWLAAFCAGVALPATELHETAPLAAFLARTQPMHALQKTTLGRAGFAAVAASTFVALAMLAGALIFGRFHCSLLCPLGSCQDAAARIASGFRTARRGSARPDRHGTGAGAARWIVAGASIGALAAGLPVVATLMEPYTVFARGFQRSVGDLVGLGLNALAALGAPIPFMTIRWEPFVFALAILPFGAVMAAAAFRSRFYCSELCPAGTFLGTLNRAARLRVRLDRNACIGCGACARVCRAHCVDGNSLDASRCVQCLDCSAVCPTGALRYGLPDRRSVRKPAYAPPGKRDGGTRTTGARVPDMPEPAAGSRSSRDPSRRRFLAGAGATAAGAALALAAPASAGMLGGTLTRHRPLGASGRPLASPPGSLSVERFAALCTACGTCVRACPSGVLRHSAFEYGAGRPGVPYLEYRRAFCQFECVACSAACPSGAILDRLRELKKREAIGKSELVLPECIVVARATRSGACAEHCPTGAVRIETVEGRPLPVPVLHVPTCIGCGACETVCPATPVKAMTVSGLTVHELADPPRKDAFAPVEAPPEEGFAF